MKRGLENILLVLWASAIKIIMNYTRWKKFNVISSILEIITALFVAHIVWSIVSSNEWYYVGAIWLSSLMSWYIVEFLLSDKWFDLIKSKILW